MRRYLKSFRAAPRLGSQRGRTQWFHFWVVGRCGTSMVNDIACSHGTFYPFPSLLSSFSRNNVDSAATTVVIKIGCFPARARAVGRTNSPEQGRDLLPLLLRSPLVFIWEGCNGGSRRSYQEQDRKNSGHGRREESRVVSRSSYTRGTVGRWDYFPRCLRASPHDRRMNVARNFCRTNVVAARQYVCHQCR